MGTYGHMVTWYPMVKLSASTRAQYHVRGCFLKGVNPLLQMAQPCFKIPEAYIVLSYWDLL